MRAHNSARKETDLSTLKAAPVHNVLMKPERGKSQSMVKAAQDTMEHDLTMAANLQDTTGLDLIAAEEIQDTMEPDHSRRLFPYFRSCIRPITAQSDTLHRCLVFCPISFLKHYWIIRKVLN